MSKVVWFVSMSLDGFTFGPNVRQEEPMGDGGEHHICACVSQRARLTARRLPGQPPTSPKFTERNCKCQNC